MLDRLLQLYLQYFSGFPPLAPHSEVDGVGLFACSPGLDGYRREPGRFPLLIRADGCPAGFDPVDRWPPLDAPLDRASAEVFVLRKDRRSGVGRRAALAVFRAHPGRWQIGIVVHKALALAFWRAVAHDLPGAAEWVGQPGRWDGLVLCSASRC